MFTNLLDTDVLKVGVKLSRDDRPCHDFKNKVCFKKNALVILVTLKKLFN